MLIFFFNITLLKYCDFTVSKASELLIQNNLVYSYCFFFVTGCSLYRPVSYECITESWVYAVRLPKECGNVDETFKWPVDIVYYVRGSPYTSVKELNLN